MKRFFKLLFLSIFYLSGVLAQDTTYYYSSNGRCVENFAEAIMQTQVSIKSAKKYDVKSLYLEGITWKLENFNCLKLDDQKHYKISDKTGSIFSKKTFLEIEKAGNGKFYFKEFYRKNLVRAGSASNIIPMHLEDSVMEYYPNKQLKSVSIYNSNQLISNENWLSDGTKYIDNIFFSVDETPEYSLGQEYFRNYILKSIQEAKIDLEQYNDNIILAWVVMEDGTITGVHRVSGRSVGLSNFMIDLIEEMSGEWVPAKLNGEIVRYFMRIPFNFTNHTQGFESLELSGGMLIWD